LFIIATSACFPVFPLALRRSYKALQAGLVFIAFVTGDIDDTVITNNGDSEKVLATVAATLYTFTDKFPEAMVFASGSTSARTRLYRIGISNNLDVINADFEIFGLTKDNNWVKFEKKKDFDAFLVKRKKK
jgi:hypothetical protein